MKRILNSLLLVMTGTMVYAQGYRSEVSSGNDAYAKEEYADAEVAYRKSLEENDNPVEGTYNLANALYKQDRWEEAEAQYRKSAEMSTDPAVKAQAFHNLGNTYMEQKKLKEAIEAYKNSLKLNPRDNETRHNLAKALKQQQQQQQQQQNQDKDQKNKDQKDQDKKDQENKDPKDQQNQDQQNKDQDGKEDKNKDNQQNQNEDQPKPDDPKDDQKGQAPRKDKISREDAQRLLDALSREEQDLQKKLNEEKIKTKPIKTDKDW
ncbi:MAG: tetratricopeptide repeat protein [Owenweeksia sp.]